jgi:hypothetical protein
MIIRTLMYTPQEMKQVGTTATGNQKGLVTTATGG